MSPPEDAAVATLLDALPRTEGLRARHQPSSFEAPKRVLDVAVASLLLAALAPLLLLVAAAIRLDSPGPVLFRQQRNGLHGRSFRMYKFRTMHWASAGPADQARAAVVDGSDRKRAADPRVTRVGLHLRRWSIDEVPNLVNVLRGEMTLVGPRPGSFSAVSYGPAAAVILSVKPGVTGLWQVMGRGDVEFARRIELECEYVRHRSMRMDLWILLRTVGAVLSRRGAY